MVENEAEWTLEINPDDVDDLKPKWWKELGFNRLSIGIQSFRDEDLQWMNRSHTARQALDALQRVRDNGFGNLSIDLIYGIPGLTDSIWERHIQQAIDLQVPHISAYALTVEPKTALHHMVEKKKHPDVDPEQQARQFLLLTDQLEAAGYEQYEISNFSLPGFRSRHNSSYWSGSPYIGIGPGAHSFDGLARYWNVAHNQQYIDAIRSGQIPMEKEELTPVQRINEYIMTRLRTSEGLCLTTMKTEWGAEWLPTWIQSAQKYVDNGKMVIMEDRMILTRSGRLFADGIAADLFLEEPG
jgi:oxygen-independent coproporphyrinogen-3 oxidase